MFSFQHALTDFAVTTFFAMSALSTQGLGRLILAISMLIAAKECFSLSLQATKDVGHNSVLGLFTIIWMLHMLNVLFIQNTPSPNGPLLHRVHMAYKMLFNARWIIDAQHNGKTFHDLAQMGQIRTPEGSKTASHRYIFVFQRIMTATGIYCFSQIYQHSLTTDRWRHYFMPLQLPDFEPGKEVFFRRLMPNESKPTSREACIRIWLVIHFLWTAWSIFTFLHCLLSAFFVGLTLDEPSEWPHLYGSLSEAHTMRKFWSRYWHRLVYRTYQAWSTRFCVVVLQADVDKWFGRMLVSLLIFLTSGLVHATVFQSLGVPGSWLEVWWFAINFVAIALEDTAVAAIKETQMITRMPGWMKRTVGYCWVFLFLFWSLPKSQYAKIYGSSAGGSG